jgi:hypothetical protein
MSIGYIQHAKRLEVGKRFSTIVTVNPMAEPRTRAFTVSRKGAAAGFAGPAPKRIIGGVKSVIWPALIHT